MTQDSSAMVRQGALVALALVMIQQPNHHPKVCLQSPFSPRLCTQLFFPLSLTLKAESTRKLFQKVAADKHEDMLAKFGAIYAQGIMEAGA